MSAPSMHPETAGFAADLADKLDAGVRSGLLPGLHAVLVSRAGQLVLERYFGGPDEDWGRPLGTVQFGPESLHDLRSTTKSIVSLLYGIALDRGQVPSPEASLLDQFPDHADLANDARRSSQRISHALTMTLGSDWNEDIPYTDPANSEIMMERAKDRIRFILEQPLIAAPGSHWTYSGGCSALIGALIAKGTGLPLAEFAQQALFDPLGISHVEWAAGEDGSYSAASGLRLRPRDLLRIGEVILGNGEWGGKRIVSTGWLKDSFRPAISTGDGIDYGRLWWLGEAPVPALGGPQTWIGGFGNGGQRLWIMPATDIAMVVMAGNYNQPDAWIWPTRIWREIVLANLRRL